MKCLVATVSMVFVLYGVVWAQVVPSGNNNNSRVISNSAPSFMNVADAVKNLPSKTIGQYSEMAQIAAQYSVNPTTVDANALATYDVDFDGVITSVDALIFAKAAHQAAGAFTVGYMLPAIAIAQYTVGLTPPASTIVFDANQDGTITITDALILAQQSGLATAVKNALAATDPIIKQQYYTQAATLLSCILGGSKNVGLYGILAAEALTMYSPTEAANILLAMDPDKAAEIVAEEFWRNGNLPASLTQAMRNIDSTKADQIFNKACNEFFTQSQKGRQNNETPIARAVRTGNYTQAVAIVSNLLTTSKNAGLYGILAADALKNLASIDAAKILLAMDETEATEIMAEGCWGDGKFLFLKTDVYQAMKQIDSQRAEKILFAVPKLQIAQYNNGRQP